jgi:hypothetical protein
MNKIFSPSPNRINDHSMLNKSTEKIKPINSPHQMQTKLTFTKSADRNNDSSLNPNFFGKRKIHQLEPKSLNFETDPKKKFNGVNSFIIKK